MKLFKVIIVLISLLLTSAKADNHTPGDAKGFIGEMPPPVWLGEVFSLNRAEKKMHESAVFFALSNTENGKIVSWYSKKRLAGGKVRVIHSYPISGGYCRTYQAYIKVNGKERHMTNNACKYIGTASWSFYK